MIKRTPWLLFSLRAFAWRFIRRAYTDDLLANQRTGNGMWRISVMNDHSGYVVWRLIRGEARAYRFGLLFGEAVMLVDRLSNGTKTSQCQCHLSHHVCHH